MNVNEINITPNQELLDKVKTIEFSLWEKANNFSWKVDSKVFYGRHPISDITVIWRLSDKRLKACVEVRFMVSVYRPTKRFDFPLCTDLERMWNIIYEAYTSHACEEGLESRHLGVKYSE